MKKEKSDSLISRLIQNQISVQELDELLNNIEDKEKRERYESELKEHFDAILKEHEENQDFKDKEEKNEANK